MDDTADGDYALVVDSGSEDVLVVAACSEVEASLLDRAGGHLPEGIVIAADDSVAHVDERTTGDVAIVRLDRTGGRRGLAATRPRSDFVAHARGEDLRSRLAPASRSAAPTRGHRWPRRR